MENLKEKPLCLRMEDARNELAAVVSHYRTECGLPFYILEPILKDLYAQIANGKAQELEIIRRDYEAKTESEVT